MSRLSRSPISLIRALMLAVLVTTVFIGSQSSARAQLTGDPVHDRSGSLSNLSTNVGAGSAPVHERGRSVRESSRLRLGGNPVRGSVTGDLRSGPVSELSVGPVTASHPVTGGGSVTESSAGAVKKDINSPLGELISEPLTDLGPLQEQLRAVQPVPRQTPMPSERLADEEAATQAVVEQAVGVLNELESPEPPTLEQPMAESPQEPQANESEAQEPAVGPKAAIADTAEEEVLPQLPSAAPAEPEIKAEAEQESVEPPAVEAEEPHADDEAPVAPDAEP